MKFNNSYVSNDFVEVLTNSFREIKLLDGSIFHLNKKLVHYYSAFRGKHYNREDNTLLLVKKGGAIIKFMAEKQHKLLYIKNLDICMCLHCGTSTYCDFDKSYGRVRCDRCGRSL